MLQDHLSTDQFKKIGVINVPKVLGQVQIDNLFNYFYSSIDNNEFGFYSTNWISNREKRESDFFKLKEIAWESIQNQFPDYKLVMGTFMIKKPGKKSSLNIHQDWVFTDEKKYNAINIWIPLTDIHEQSGGINFIKHSYKVNNPIRGKLINQIFKNDEKYLQNRFSTSFFPSAGDALIFDVRTAHFSYSNESENMRIAISLVITPIESDTIVYYKKKKSDKKIIKAKVENDYFYNYRWDEIPNNGLIIEKTEFYLFPKLKRITAIIKIFIHNRLFS